MEQGKAESSMLEGDLGGIKKVYVGPKVTIYGDARDITLKIDSLQDHNQGNNTMGWS